jgi:hypothetical protein
MSKDPAVVVSPSFPRFILWEIIGIAGFLHILQFAPANDSTPLFFLANAVVFIAVYPTLYFFSQLNIPAVLKYLISPLSIVLRIILMLSCFVWVTYILYSSGFLLGNVSCYVIFKNYYLFLAPFFIFDYFVLVEHLWGVSKSNFTFWASVGTLSDSVSGIVGGFYLGRVLNEKWGIFFGDDDIRALIWIVFVLIGVAAVVWFGNKTRKG